MIAKYRRLSPPSSRDDQWRGLNYDDHTQQITLLDSIGRGYHTYFAGREEMREWVVMATRSGAIVSDIDDDIVLDIGL